MKVDFNGLRRRACVEVNCLADWLDTVIFASGNMRGNTPGTLKLDAGDIEELAEMVNCLVSTVYFIATTYDGGNPDMRDLTDEVEEPIYVEVANNE